MITNKETEQRTEKETQQETEKETQQETEQETSNANDYDKFFSFIDSISDEEYEEILKNRHRNNDIKEEDKNITCKDEFYGFLYRLYVLIIIPIIVMFNKIKNRIGNKIKTT